MLTHNRVRLNIFLSAKNESSQLFASETEEFDQLSWITHHLSHVTSRIKCSEKIVLTVRVLEICESTEPLYSIVCVYRPNSIIFSNLTQTNMIPLP